MPLKTFTHIGRGRDLTIEEQEQFYNSMKSCVWVLKIRNKSSVDENKESVDVACGLCIDDMGHILTTSCVLGEAKGTIFGRDINSNSFQELKITKRGNSMFILEPTKKKKEGYDYAVVSDDSMQMTECQEVYCIAHELSGLYSFAVGEVSHRKRVINDIGHFQVANVHTRGHSDIIFSSTGHVMGIVLRKLSHMGGCEKPDLGHNLVLHCSEINKFLKTFRPRPSRSKKTMIDW